MKLVADSRGRLTAANLFRPGAAYDASLQPDGSIRIVHLVEADVPIIEPVEKEGLLLSPVQLSPEIIAAAIRAERDER
jgi:hypothetical protein